MNNLKENTNPDIHFQLSLFQLSGLKWRMSLETRRVFSKGIKNESIGYHSDPSDADGNKAFNLTVFIRTTCCSIDGTMGKGENLPQLPVFVCFTVIW